MTHPHGNCGDKADIAVRGVLRIQRNDSAGLCKFIAAFRTVRGIKLLAGDIDIQVDEPLDRAALEHSTRYRCMEAVVGVRAKEIMRKHTVFKLALVLAVVLEQIFNTGEFVGLLDNDLRDGGIRADGVRGLEGAVGRAGDDRIVGRASDWAQSGVQLAREELVERQPPARRVGPVIDHRILHRVHRGRLSERIKDVLVEGFRRIQEAAPGLGVIDEPLAEPLDTLDLDDGPFIRYLLVDEPVEVAEAVVYFLVFVGTRFSPYFVTALLWYHPRKIIQVFVIPEKVDRPRECMVELVIKLSPCDLFGLTQRFSKRHPKVAICMGGKLVHLLVECCRKRCHLISSLFKNKMETGTARKLLQIIYQLGRKLTDICVRTAYALAANSVRTRMREKRKRKGKNERKGDSGVIYLVHATSYPCVACASNASKDMKVVPLKYQGK